MSGPLRNMVALVLGDAGSRVIGFLVTVYIARVLTPDGFGVVTVGLAVLGYLGLIASPGVQILETRNVAASPKDMPRRVGAVLSLRLLLSVLVIAAAWGVARAVIDESRTADVIGLYALSLIPMALGLDWWFQGKEDFRAVGASRLMQFAVYAAAAVMLVRSPDDLLEAPRAFLIGSTAATLLLLGIYTLRNRALPFHVAPALWRSILKDNLPVGGAVLAAQAATSLPPIVIAAFLGTVPAAEYGAAMRLVFMFLFADRMIHALLLPAISRQLARDRQRARLTAAVVLKSQIVFLVPAGLVLMLAAAPILGVLYGAPYETAGPMLQILASYVLLTLMNTVFVCVLVGGGREREYTRIMTVGSSLMAVLIVGLTSVAGPGGAALAVAAGEAAIAIWMFLRARDILPVVRPWRGILTLVLIACAGPALAFLPGLAVAIVVPVVVYGSALVLVGGLTGAEITHLRTSLT